MLRQFEGLESVNGSQNILKLAIRKGDSGGERIFWAKGSKALFHYTTYTYKEEEIEKPAHVHSEKCNHSHDKHQIINQHEKSNPENSRPVRVKIADSRDDNAPFELRIDMGFAVTMFEKCLKTMLPGEVAKFLVMPVEYTGYSALERTLRDERRRRKQGIEHAPRSCCSHGAITSEHPDLDALEHSPLELEIHFLELQPPGTYTKELWEMTHEEKFIEAPNAKEEGSKLYAAGKYQEASEKYRRAIMLLESIILSAYMIDAEREISMKSFQDAIFKEYEGQFVNPRILYCMLQACRLNFAACRLKLQDYTQVISQCTEVLKKETQNVKALFRRAQAYCGIGRDLELAEADFGSIKKYIIGKEDLNFVLAAVKREEAVLAQKQKLYLRHEQNMYSKLFA